MDVRTGEVTIRLPGSRAREQPLRGLRGAGRRWGPHGAIKDHRPTAYRVVHGR